MILGIYSYLGYFSIFVTCLKSIMNSLHYIIMYDFYYPYNIHITIYIPNNDRIYILQHIIYIRLNNKYLYGI